MKSCNRGIVSVLLCIGLSQGCSADGPDLAVTTAATLSVDGTVVLPATGWGDPGVTTSPVPTGWPTGSVAWCCTNWWIPVPAQPGDVVGSIAALVQDVAPSPLYIPGSQGDGGSSVTLSLVAQVGSTTTTLGSLSSNGSGAQQSRILTLATPYTVPPGASLLIEATAIAIWPSSVMHPSVIGPVTFAAPAIQNQGDTTRSIALSGLYVTPDNTSLTGASRSLGKWTFLAFPGVGPYMDYPLPVRSSDVIIGYRWWANKPNASSDLHAVMFSVDSVTGSMSVVGGTDAFVVHGTSGAVVASIDGMSIVVHPRTTYLLAVQEQGGIGTTTFADAELTIR